MAPDDSPLLINLAMLMQRPTGISTYALNVVPHLAPLQPRLLTAQPDRFPGFSSQAIPANLTAEQGSLGHARRLAWTQTRLAQLYRQRRASLIFSPVPEMPLWRDCPTVVMVHDFIPLRFGRWRSPLTQYFRWVVPQVLDQATHIICNSQSTADDVLRFGGVSAAKVTPIPLAHDGAHFRFLNLPRQNYFLYLGRQDPYKGIDRAIAAFAQLPPSLVKAQDCELWIAGGPDPRFTPRLQAQVEALDLGDRVKFLGYVPYGDLPRLLNQALAFVFPSQWEGFGLPVLEAMACGTPVITADGGALPEVAAEAALVVSAGPPSVLGAATPPPVATQALALAMTRLAQDSDCRAQLQARGLARAAQFSWAETGARTLAQLRASL